jgi:hypothetical protein
MEEAASVGGLFHFPSTLFSAIAPTRSTAAWAISYPPVRWSSMLSATSSHTDANSSECFSGQDRPSARQVSDMWPLGSVDIQTIMHAEYSTVKLGVVTIRSGDFTRTPNA